MFLTKCQNSFIVSTLNVFDLKVLLLLTVKFSPPKKANQKLTCILAFSVLGMQARDVHCFVSSLLHLIVSIGSDSAQFVS